VFLADTPTFADRPEYRLYQALEPTIVLRRLPPQRNGSA
jgi:hypothetical protein